MNDEELHELFLWLMHYGPKTDTIPLQLRDKLRDLDAVQYDDTITNEGVGTVRVAFGEATYQIQSVPIDD